MRTSILALLLTAGLSQAATHHVLCAGLGGEPDYDTRFTSLVNDAAKLLAAPGDTVTALTGAQSSKESLRAAIAKAIASASPDDTLVITFIGHGTFDGTDYRFNIPGPDLTAAELAQSLAPSRARTVVILATSASGGAIAALRAPNRVIISATRAGTEKNAVVFSRFWVDALRDAAADSDKNESVSALEAFRFAALKTTRYYETLKRLATEHPVIEDTGKADAVADPSPQNGQGLLASRTPIARFGSVQKALSNPAKQALLKRKETVEQAIDKLKYEKAALPIEDYRKQLAALLLQLAQIQEEIEK
jgi:hypothetical protein